MGDKVLDCEVLIVGGGPAGLSVASTLPDDIDTIIVHQDAEIGRPLRTSGGSWTSDMHRLGIPEDCYQTLLQNEAFSDNVHVILPLTLDRPVILEVTKLYKWLATQSDHKKRRLFLSTKFLGCEKQADGSYLSKVRSRSGGFDAVRSKYIVDGSGWHMAVLSSLGLREKPERLAVGIEYEFDLGKNRPDRAFIFTGSDVPAGYGWGFPTRSGKFHLGVGIIQPDTEKSPRELIDKVMANDPERRFGIDLSGPYEVNAGILPSVSFDPKVIFGNVVRTGDSANFATPTAGEGIRFCIEFGRDLGVALGKVARGGSRWHLKRHEWRVARRLFIDYYFGFVMNTRGARFTPAQWDASISRMGRVTPEALTDLMRSEFRPRKIYWMVHYMVRGRLERYRDRLLGRS
jgi:flavin-dependent dehydrogenase